MAQCRMDAEFPRHEIEFDFNLPLRHAINEAVAARIFEACRSGNVEKFELFRNDIRRNIRRNIFRNDRAAVRETLERRTRRHRRARKAASRQHLCSRLVKFALLEEKEEKQRAENKGEEYVQPERPISMIVGFTSLAPDVVPQAQAGRGNLALLKRCPWWSPEVEFAFNRAVLIMSQRQARLAPPPNGVAFARYEWDPEGGMSSRTVPLHGTPEWARLPERPPAWQADEEEKKQA